MESRKKAVSIRISSSDIRKIKRLAIRLGVRDSDVIRFAVKSMLAKLEPLHDPSMRGRSLVPVFVESGAELFHHFDLDAMRLESIINEEAEQGRRVDHEDIQLIAMSGAQQPYLRWRLTRTAHAGRGTHAVNDAASNGTNGRVPDAAIEHASEVMPSLREYLYEKYVYRNSSEA